MVDRATAGQALCARVMLFSAFHYYRNAKHYGGEQVMMRAYNYVYNNNNYYYYLLL